MRKERIIKRKDGTQFKITVTFYIDNPWSASIPTYKVSVVTKKKRQRKWRKIETSINNYAYRRMSIDERNHQDLIDILQYVTEDEIYQTKMQLWELLKPKK